MRALVIDDSRAMRSIMKQNLTQLAFEVSEAQDGRDALARLRVMPRPDVMLVDWNMPNMNGLEFVLAVRADADFADVRLMMVTTENEAQQVARALAAGADEFLMKPFTPDCFREKLELLGVLAPKSSEDVSCVP